MGKRMRGPREEGGTRRVEGEGVKARWFSSVFKVTREISNGINGRGRMKQPVVEVATKHPLDRGLN